MDNEIHILLNEISSRSCLKTTKLFEPFLMFVENLLRISLRVLTRTQPTVMVKLWVWRSISPILSPGLGPWDYLLDSNFKKSPASMEFIVITKQVKRSSRRGPNFVEINGKKLLAFPKELLNPLLYKINFFLFYIPVSYKQLQLNHSSFIWMFLTFNSIMYM